MSYKILPMKALADARAKAADLREQARKERATAWTDFETAVYAAEDDGEAFI